MSGLPRATPLVTQSALPMAQVWALLLVLQLVPPLVTWRAKQSAKHLAKT
jgi:hypothetical protein